MEDKDRVERLGENLRAGRTEALIVGCEFCKDLFEPTGRGSGFDNGAVCEGKTRLSKGTGRGESAFQGGSKPGCRSLGSQHPDRLGEGYSTTDQLSQLMKKAGLGLKAGLHDCYLSENLSPCANKSP